MLDAPRSDRERLRHDLGRRRRLEIDVAPILEMAQQPKGLIGCVVGAVTEEEAAPREKLHERGDPRFAVVRRAQPSLEVIQAHGARMITPRQSLPALLYRGHPCPRMR